MIAPENILFGFFMAWIAWFVMHYFSVGGGYIAAKLLGFKSAVMIYNSYFGLFQKPSYLDVKDDEIFKSEKKRGLFLLVVLCGILVGLVPLVLLFLLPFVIAQDPNLKVASLFSIILISLYICMALSGHVRFIWRLISGNRINETGNVPEKQT